MSHLPALTAFALVVGYVVVSSVAWFVWALMRARRVQGWRSRPRPRRAADRYMLLRPPYVEVYAALFPALIALEGIVSFGVPLILVMVGLSNPWGVSSKPLDYAVGAVIVLIISLVFLWGLFLGVNLYVRTFIRLLRRDLVPDFAATQVSDEASDVPTIDEAAE